MPKNKQSNFIANAENAKHKFYQQIYYKLRNKGEGGGGYSVLVNYPSFLSNIFPLAPPPPQLFFSLKYKPNTLLHVRFIG